MLEEEEKRQGARLWAVDTRGKDREGVPMWPVFIILLIGAALIGFVSIPCIGLRLDHVRHAGPDAKMSVWRMECTAGLGNSCVCVQRATSTEGGYDCEVSNDMIEKCEIRSADKYRGEDF